MRFKELDRYLRGCVDALTIPGCVCWAGDLSTLFFYESYGRAQIVPREEAMTKETVFDLASLTKPVATASSIMLLHERQRLDIDAELQHVMPVFEDTAAARKTIRQLLAHTSGLPAWYPLYLVPKQTRLQYLANLAVGREETVYSCLGYILLGKMIEHVTGKRMDIFFSEDVVGGLALHTLGFGPVADRDAVAATEQGNEHEQEMARKHGDVSHIAWRKYTIRGKVHDGNAHYAFSGVAGNAGLFSNATDLVTFLRAYLAGKIVKPRTFTLMLKAHPPSGETRNLGWHVNPYPGLLSPLSFGHTGFTGTMAVIDPQTNLIIVLLANAVHPTVRIGLMKPIRQEV
ncbi:serine hydrolase, partial [candidate division WOR-3 bacterium]|nr:serine hydrolase [candidate division WOR-3 bacterium]